MTPPNHEHQTVLALRNTLTALPDDALVVLSSDAEGNSYRLLDGADFEEIHWNHVHQEPTDVPTKDTTRAIILYPEH